MKNLFNLIMAFFYGLAPLLFIGIISLFVYNELPNTLGVGIIACLVVLSIWWGVKIFQKVIQVGALEVMSAVSSYPDLDNLEPTAESTTKRRTPLELVNSIAQQSNLLKGGTIKIYGDWLGRPYDNYHTIQHASFDELRKTLIIEFDCSEKLEIYNPQHILEAPTFLKIIKADRVKLSTYSTKEKLHYYKDYRKMKNEIIVQANYGRQLNNTDVSIAEPALMFYG